MATPERWQQIEKLYLAAVTLAAEERAPLLAAAEPEIRRAVESLLRQPDSTETLTIGGVAAVQQAAGRPGPHQVGPYVIEGSLGSGGMGEVFRAIDTRLNRAVAIKFCDARFIERFAREARAISALNHPNICTLYDVGPHYLVMELIDGQTLSACIRQGPLAFKEVVQYGAQIANALAAAHEAGIVHRDLKPGNVMVAKHGVKVLDFGLAKLSTAFDDVLTRTNAVMGTPAYMAPEQVRGNPADARADLFALGLILHEMAAGKLPFPGVSLGTMLASDDSVVLPPPSKARPGFPSTLDRLIARLLSAAPSNRPANAANVREELLALAAPNRKSNRTAVIAVAAVVAIVVAAGAWWWLGNSKLAPMQVVNLRPLAAFPGDKLDPAFSPDGATIAFSWHGEKDDAPGIYLMPVSGGLPRRLTQTSNDDVSPVWDPAGKRITFLRLRPGKPSEVMIVDVDGGADPKKVRDVSMPEYLRRERPVFAWTHDGNALVMPMDDIDSGGASLFRVALDGGPQSRLVRSLNGIGVTSPVYSDDGRWLAYQQSEPPRLYAQPLAANGSPEGEAEIVVDNSRGASPSWAPDGSQLWFIAGSRILAWEPSSHSSQTVYASPSPIQGMSAYWKTGGKRGVPEVVFSVEGAQPEVRSLELTDGGRKAAGQSQLVLTNAWNQSFSPDGKWITYGSNSAGNEEIWLATANGEHRRQLTHRGFFEASAPAFSLDGKHIAFHGREPTMAQLYVIDLDPAAELAKPEGVKSEPPIRQITKNSFSVIAPLWSADGKYLYALTTKAGLRLLRIPSSGGEVEDLFEADGTNTDPEANRLYYGKPDNTGLYTRSLEGDIRSNAEQRVLTDYSGLQHVAINKNGVFYVSSDTTGKRVANRFFDFSLGKSFDLGPPSRGIIPHLTVVPDGHRLVYSTNSDAPGSLTLMQLQRGAN